MATNTTNYNLVKPGYSDTADIADINGNMDIIDGQMKTNADNITALNTKFREIKTRTVTETTSANGNCSFTNTALSNCVVLCAYTDYVDNGTRCIVLPYHYNASYWGGHVIKELDGNPVLKNTEIQITVVYVDI